MCSRILVDTDVLIDYVKGRCELPIAEVYISEITLYDFIRDCKDPKSERASWRVFFRDI